MFNCTPGCVFEHPSSKASDTAAFASASAGSSSAVARGHFITVQGDLMREDESDTNPVQPTTEICQKSADRGVTSAHGRYLSGRFIVEPSRGSVSELQFERLLLSSTFKCAPALVIRTNPCRASRRSSWRIQLTILRHPSLLLDVGFRILSLALKKSPQNSNF